MAFFNTFIAYSFPVSFPTILRTRNTWSGEGRGGEGEGERGEGKERVEREREGEREGREGEGGRRGRGEREGKERGGWGIRIMVKGQQRNV